VRGGQRCWRAEVGARVPHGAISEPPQTSTRPLTLKLRSERTVPSRRATASNTIASGGSQLALMILLPKSSPTPATSIVVAPGIRDR
jgi:hypothetical protein